MKICYLSYKEDNHAQKWINYFKKRGHEVYSLKILRTRIKSLNLILNILPVIIQLKIIRPDILHAHYAGFNGILAAFTGFHPFLLTAQGSDILIITKSKTIKILVKFVLKRADIITCDAYHMKEAIIKMGANESKINIIYFGVDTKKFFPNKKKRKGLTVISLRNLDLVYNVNTFINAIPLILKEAPETRFTIVGQGTEKEKLMKLAKNLKVLDRIDFLGWISEEEIIEEINKADIYVSTSLSDAGIAASTAEAMACGLPVVVSNFGDNKQWVKEGEGGFLFPLEDYKSLAEKVITLLKDKEMREKFGIFNRCLIEEKNNYYKEMEKMEKIYEKFSKEIS